jgi:Pectate lyase superfamily protein
MGYGGKNKRPFVQVDNQELAAQLAENTKKVEGIVSVKDFGAKGDGVNNDTVPIQTAIDSLSSGQTILIPPGTYIIDTLSFGMPDDCRIDCRGKFISNTSGVAITIGHPTELRVRYNVKGINVSAVMDQQASLVFRVGSVGVQIVNVSMSDIEIKDVYGFETGIQQIGTSGVGCAINDIFIGRLRNNKQSVRLTSSGGWVTETTYHGGSFQHGGNLSSRDGLAHVVYDPNPSYHFDNVHFFRPAFESTGTGEKAVIIPAFVNGQTLVTRCGFFMPRNEGSTKYDFGGSYNYIHSTFTTASEINDTGYGNEYNVPDVLYKAGASTTSGVVKGYNRSGNTSPVFEALAFNKSRAWMVDGNGRQWLTASGIMFGAGSSSPEGVISAPAGSLWLRTDGGLGTTVYVKSTGTGNTGWSGLHPLTSGTTANRPTLPPNPYMYFDTTLNKPIFHRGSNVWVDATGTVV